MKRSSSARWRAVWTSWALSFATMETLALRSKDPDAPLSAHLRWVFGFQREGTPITVGRQIVGMGAWLWVLVHLVHRPRKEQ